MTTSAKGAGYPDQREPIHPGAHPTLDELIRYNEQGSDEEEIERLRDHLSLCVQCCKTLLEVQEFADDPKGPVNLIDTRDVSLLYQNIVAQSRAQRFRTATSIAASLAVLFAGVLLYRELSSAYGPREFSAAALKAGEANLPFANLYPETQTRSSSSSNHLVIPAAAPVFALILPVVDLPSYPSFRLDLIDSKDRTVLSLDGLVPTLESQFQVWVPAQGIETGSYKLVLSAAQGEEFKLLENYEVSVERTTGP